MQGMFSTTKISNRTMTIDVERRKLPCEQVQLQLLQGHLQVCAHHLGSLEKTGAFAFCLGILQSSRTSCGHLWCKASSPI